MARVSCLAPEDVQGHFELKDMIFSFVTPFMLKTVILLDIPNILSSGPLTLQQIVSRLKDAKSPDPNILRRVLDFLVHKRVFAATTAPDGQVLYSLTNISKWLQDEHHLALLCTHPVPHAAFHRLHEAVLEGGHAYEKTTGAHVWAAEDEEYHKLLNEAMLCWSGVTMNLILENYDGFKDAKTLVDVGGGLGMCLEKIIAKYPHIKGINLEIPPTAAAAPKIAGVEHVGGDMYKHIPSGDTIMIKSVFINIGDKDCELVLRNAYKALPKKGKVIIIELLHSKDGAFEYTLDVCMLGYCSGGRTRSEQELRTMLTDNGFSNISVKRVPSREQVIEAYKV